MTWIRPRALCKCLVLLLAGSVAVAAAPLTWHLRGHSGVMPPAPRLRTETGAERTATDLSQTMELAPFGAVASPAATPEAAPPEAPDMALLGVIVRDDPTRSMALIDVAGDEANYRPGDTVAEGATLTDIARDHVVLDIDGTPRRLGFAGDESTIADADVPSGADRLRALIFSGGGPTISEQVDAAERAQPETTQDYIDMWRDRIRANPAQVLDSLGLVATENGYRIGEEHDVGIDRAGLKAGDLVKSVNGQNVGNVKSDRALYDKVAASGMARLEIVRGGRTITMSFPLE